MIPGNDPTHDTQHRRAGVAAVLRRLVDGFDEPTVSVGAIADRLGSRAFGFIILLAALPMIVPNVPGVSTVFGLLIIFPALQIAIGRRRVRLPRRVRRYAFSSAKIKAIVIRALPTIQKMERILRMRWRPLTRGAPLNAVGALTLLLAVLMALPIPGANAPPAVACALMAIGIIERDGVVVALGIAAGLAALAFAASIVWGFFFVASAVAS
jgi:hypothetical protein